MMRRFPAEPQEGFLFAIVLMIGALLMLIAGHFAMQMPATWQIQDTSMDSELNPNEVYALYREDYDFKLAAIRTDVPNLLATGAVVNPNPEVPPPAINFRAPMQIATTTPFWMPTLTPPGANTLAATQATATAGTITPGQTATIPAVTPPVATASVTFSLTPTFTLVPTNTLVPTRTRTLVPSSTTAPTQTARPADTLVPTVTISPSVTASRTATARPSRTIAPATPTITRTRPASTATGTITPSPTNTQTRTSTVTSTITSTATITPEPTSTFTSTPTPTNTSTATPTNTPTATEMPECIINGSGNYTVPVGGCTVRFDTNAQGAIISIAMVGSGNLTVNWFGLPEGLVSGTCAARTANLTRGNPITEIAVSEYPEDQFTIDNGTTRPIVIYMLIVEWTTGGCQ